MPPTGNSDDEAEALGRAFGQLILFLFVKPVVAIFQALRSGSVLSMREQEIRDTKSLYDDVCRLNTAYNISVKVDAEEFVDAVVGDAINEAIVDCPAWLQDALKQTVASLWAQETPNPDSIDWKRKRDAREWLSLRRELRRAQHFLTNHQYLTEAWRDHLVVALRVLIESIAPLGMEKAEPKSPLYPTSVRILDCIDNVPELVEGLVAWFFDHQLIENQLFGGLQSELYENVMKASGFRSEDASVTNASVVLATEQKGKSAEAIVDLYLRNTAFLDMLCMKVPFTIPTEARFEHCHILGGTGHGKTQLLQQLIYNDLLKVQRGEASVIVIDSQGDLIDTISHLDLFDPDNELGLADKFVLVDPSDFACPVALNLFDAHLKSVEGSDAVEREKILNGTIELYEYIFGALLGAELTQKQGVIFRYIARLMLSIPGATIHTLRELMEDGKPFRPYIERLEGTPRIFFETQFFHPSFNATKSQMLKRLWGVLANPAFERMFSSRTNKIDLFELMGAGKVVLINTSKDLLKQEGCEIFGRFFIAMIAQAAMRRASISREERLDCYVFIDEAQDYFDAGVEHLLSQARKYRVGVHLAHQNLGQLGEKLKQSIMASTSVKFAGGVSSKDASALAHDMRASIEALLSTRKAHASTSFVCFVRNEMTTATTVSVPLGVVETAPRLDGAAYHALLAHNRKVYGQRPEDKVEVSVSSINAKAQTIEVEEKTSDNDRVTSFASEEPITREQPMLDAPREQKPTADRLGKGQGGKEHQYLQNLIKQFATDRGFHAVIEKEILDGTGRVDVALTKAGVSLACEISVTTSVEHELRNIEKCLASGFNEVVVISSNPKRVDQLQKAANEHFGATYFERIHFLTPDGFIGRLDALEADTEVREQTVRGYKVRVNHSPIDPAEREARRKSIAEVIARSIRHVED